MCCHSAYNNAIKSTVFKVHLAKLAPRAGVKLIVNADHAIESNAAKYNIVSVCGIEQFCADIIDACIAGSVAGYGATNKDDRFAVGTIVPIAQIAIFAISVHFAVVRSLAHGVIANAVAENTVSIIAVIIYGDIHSAAELVLGIDILLTGQCIELCQCIGVGLGTITSSTLIGHSGDRQHDGQHKDSQQNA